MLLQLNVLYLRMINCTNRLMFNCDRRHSVQEPLDPILSGHLLHLSLIVLVLHTRLVIIESMHIVLLLFLLPVCQIAHKALILSKYSSLFLSLELFLVLLLHFLFL